MRQRQEHCPYTPTASLHHCCWFPSRLQCVWCAMAYPRQCSGSGAWWAARSSWSTRTITSGSEPSWAGRASCSGEMPLTRSKASPQLATHSWNSTTTSVLSATRYELLFTCVYLKRVNDQEFTSGSELRVGWCECVYALISSRTWTVLWSLRAVISSTLAVWRNGFMSRRLVPFVTRNSRANHRPPLPPTKTPLQPIRALQGRTKPRPVSSRKRDLLLMMGTRRKRESRRGMLDLSRQLEKPRLVFPRVPRTWRLHHHLALLLHHLWLDLTSLPLVIPHRLPPLCLTHWTCPLPPPTFTPCPYRRQHRQRWSPLTPIPPTQLKLGFLPDSQESPSGPPKSLCAPF